MKYKILGIILIVGLIGLIVAIILVATSDGGTRQQAEDFLESAVKAQNTARLFDVRQVQSGLSNYFRINSAYPRTLTEAGTMIPQLHQTDISNPEHISYEQTKNGQGYLISFSFSDGRKFEVDETQSALDYQEEAERIPEEFFASSEYQESISQLTEQQRQLTQRGAQEEFIPITRIDKAGAVILSPQFEGLPNSGNVTGRSFSKNGEKLVFGWSRGFNDNSIWIMGSAENQARKLWEGEVVSMRGASRKIEWSPDDSRIMLIIFERNSTNTSDITSLYIMNPEDNHLKRLSLPDQSVEVPAWSSDSKEIIFRDRGLSDESKEKFLAVDINTGVQSDVIEIEGRVLHYQISLRDNEIFFLVQSKEGEQLTLSNDIVRFNRNTRAVSHFAASEIGEDVFLVNPTGSKIVYIGGRASYPFLKDLIIANLDGTDRQVVQNYNGGRDTKTTHILRHPSGSKIALLEVTRDLKGSVNVFSLSSLSFTRTEVFAQLEPNAILSWNQDGDLMLATARRSEPFLLIRNFE